MLGHGIALNRREEPLRPTEVWLDLICSDSIRLQKLKLYSVFVMHL